MGLQGNMLEKLHDPPLVPLTSCQSCRYSKMLLFHRCTSRDQKETHTRCQQTLWKAHVRLTLHHLWSENYCVARGSGKLGQLWNNRVQVIGGYSALLQLQLLPHFCDPRFAAWPVTSEWKRLGIFWHKTRFVTHLTLRRLKVAKRDGKEKKNEPHPRYKATKPANIDVATVTSFWCSEIFQSS